jgi:hypothetical protein
MRIVQSTPATRANRQTLGNAVLVTGSASCFGADPNRRKHDQSSDLNDDRSRTLGRWHRRVTVARHRPPLITEQGASVEMC